MEINLGNKDRNYLRKIQRKHRGTKKYIRITVVLMLDGGFSGTDTAYALGIDSDTVSSYKKKYLNAKNLEDYLCDNYVAYKGKLSEKELEGLSVELQRHLYRDTKEIANYIKTAFGKIFTSSGLVPLLHRLGFSYKKTRQESIKADRTKQEAFVKEMREHLDSLDEDNVAYYMDGVHPQHNTKSEHGWIKTGGDFIVSANTGRKRVNINGALNAHDVTDVLIDETESVNAQSTIRLMKKALRRHKNKKQIDFYCDNAAYYRSKILKAFLAQNLKINLIYLPSYSPNLNLIERLWKFMKKKIINSFYYEKYEEFKIAILKFFKNIRKYRHQLNALLTLNFQIIGQ